MRKVKVLAFVLAALMVVAAFAGCGTKQLKTDVSTLDERVTALEELLKQVNSTVNNAATAGQIEELLEAITANKAEAAAGDKALADAIAKITADQTAANATLKADLEKLVNDAKADQKVGDANLQVAIEKLNSSLAATNKALEDSIKDLLKEIADGDEDLTGAIADTNKALADAIATINKAQEAQGKDVAAALAATNKALEDAIKTLQESAKESDDAIREDLTAAIEALTAAQNKQGEDLTKALEESNKALTEALENLKDSTDANDAAIREDLTAAIEALTAAQNKQGEDLTKALEESNKALTDALAELKNSTDANDAAIREDLTAAIEALTAAQNKQGEDLAKALADSNKTLTEALEALKDSTSASDEAIRDDLAAAIDALTAAQAKALEDSNKALTEAIASLQDAMAKNDEALQGSITQGDETLKDYVDALIGQIREEQAAQTAEINKTLEAIMALIQKNQEDAGANVDLQSAINLYVGNLTVSKNDYAADSVSYTAEENLAIAALHSNGIAAVQAATKVEDAKKAYDDTIAGLAEYTAKDDQLYKEIVALKGNLTKNTKASAAKLVELKDEVVAHYGTDNAKRVTEYLDPNGKKVNLVTETTKIKTYQDAVDKYTTTSKSSTHYSASIAKLVADIKDVKGVWIDTYVSGDTTHYGNIATISALKDRYDVFVDAISGRQESAKYISDSLLDLITNADTLEAYVEKANDLAAAKATLPSYSELASDGTYKGVFAEYANDGTSGILNEDAATANWWNTVEVYETISARVDEWLADNPVVDNENAHAIINALYNEESTDADDTYSFYANYLKNEEEAALFLGKYNYYVDTILPDVTELEKMSAVTTANVKKFAELEEAIADWKIVIPDSDDDDELPELEIVPAHFKAMLDAMYGDNIKTRTAAFPFAFKVAAVQTFFTTTVTQAKDVANKINETIADLVKAEASALDTLPYRTLEGYKQVGTSGVYKMDTTSYSVADVTNAAEPTIYMFKKAFVTTNYDLTYLLETDDLAASCKVVEDKIASYKVISDKIHATLGDVEKALTFRDLNGDNVKDPELAKVSLDNESAVMTLKADYSALTAKGYKYDTTKAWTKNTNNKGQVINGEFRNDRLMETQDYYDITGLVMRVEELRAMATSLVTFFKVISEVNGYTALTVADADVTDAIFNKVVTTEKDGSETTTYDYIGSYTNLSDVLSLRSFNPTYNVDVDESQISNVMTQADAVELAWLAYAKFITDNQGKKDTAVEVALADYGLVDLKLLVIKAKAYNEIAAVNSTSTGYNWDDDNYGDFATEQKIQLASVKDAPSVDIVADILFGFRQKTLVDYKDVTFAGELIFHKNGHRHLSGTNVTCPETEYHP